MRRIIRRPSPATAIALLALFVALGGTSYAAFSLPKNSVGTKQLKRDAVTTSKIKRHAVTAAKINPAGLTVPAAQHATTASSAINASALGGEPASAYSPRLKWAQVAGDGSIIAQSGGITVLHPVAGAYYVNFGSAVDGHAVSVTALWTPGDSDNTGTNLTAPCGTGTGSVGCDESNNNDTLWVESVDKTDTFADRGFFVVLYP
jgi:hypothetical protein